MCKVIFSLHFRLSARKYSNLYQNSILGLSLRLDPKRLHLVFCEWITRHLARITAVIYYTIALRYSTQCKRRGGCSQWRRLARSLVRCILSSELHVVVIDSATVRVVVFGWFLLSMSYNYLECFVYSKLSMSKLWDCVFEFHIECWTHHKVAQSTCP